jgi:hypothetical protein
MVVEVALKTIQIVTFNDEEHAAVQEFMDELAEPHSVWRRKGEDRLIAPDICVLWHTRTPAQGNVMACAHLVMEFERTSPPDFLVFYGCAGAADRSPLRSGYLVEAVLYLSLGVVRPHSGGEEVKLENRWLDWHDPEDVTPITPVSFRLSSNGARGDLVRLTGIPAAHVASTDKKIQVRPEPPPEPLEQSFGRRVYRQEAWSYGTALGYATDVAATNPLLVDMESFGIGKAAEAMNLQDRVIILRVVSDLLIDRGKTDKEVILSDGIAYLARVVLALADPDHPLNGAS